MVDDGDQDKKAQISYVFIDEEGKKIPAQLILSRPTSAKTSRSVTDIVEKQKTPTANPATLEGGQSLPDNYKDILLVDHERSSTDKNQDEVDEAMKNS